MTTTATTHDTISAIVDTWKIERVYSPVPSSARSRSAGSPATVTSVPVSIGNAVLVYAKLAARKRSKPCSILIAIISTAMIASSTSRPSDEDQRAERDLVQADVEQPHAQRTSSRAPAGSTARRRGRCASRGSRSDTASTISTASASERTNSLTERCTARGCSATCGELDADRQRLLRCARSRASSVVRRAR